MTGSPDGMSLLERVEAVVAQTLVEADAATSSEEIEATRRAALGRSGALLQVRRAIGAIPASDRKKVGIAVDAAQQRLQRFLDKRISELRASRPATRKEFDVSLPGISPSTGSLHPTVQLMYDLNDAFAQLNFEVFDGPEISSERFEFDFLNFPPEHPARESMDTFWLTETAGSTSSNRMCLRPHLTGASVRFMQEHKPPFRFVYPGRVYRNESTDARHERAFFQYEALIIDRDVPLTSGKFLVETVLNTVFGRHVETRMRTGFFPFVEPGFEIDMQCQVCGGGGCKTCRQVGWLEIMPGGVPHPNVLRSGGLDPDEWTGFYVNVGLDRLVMMRYGIDDVRLFHSADLRFLAQFG